MTLSEKVFTDPYDLKKHFTTINHKNRTKWLEGRVKGIGASECGSIIGVNQWKSNLELWQEKVSDDFVDTDDNKSPQMVYGIEAEAPLRRLYELSHPEYHMNYRENVTLRSKQHKFMLYSPDGLLYDIEKDRYGLYEGKTAAVNSKALEIQWENQIPQNYFTQILHGLSITKFDFAVVNVELRKERRDENGKVYLTFIRKDYTFERSDYLEDIQYLIGKEKEFWELVIKKERPPLILNI